MTACTSMEPVANAPSNLRAGDVIRVQTTSGKQLSLQVSTVGPSGVSGTTPDNAVVQIPSSDMANVERQEFDWVKSAGLFVVIVAAAFGIGAALGRGAASQIVSH